MTVVADRLTEYKTRARSWSQLSQYETCPKAYYLARITQAWEKPDAWRPMGTALHTAVEYWETHAVSSVDEVLPVAQRAYREGVQVFLDETPNADAWHSSGTYKGTVDIPRRYAKLREHLEAYGRMRANLPPLRGDMASVEGEVTFDACGVAVTGFVDQIRQGVIVDLKTGSKKPEDASQLALYAAAIEQQTGERFERGAYVMTGVGRPTPGRIFHHDLVTIRVESLTARFHAMDDGVKNERFDPKPGEACRRCGVLSSCPEGQQQLREARK